MDDNIMGYPYSFYMICERGANNDRRIMYTETFRHLLHIDHNADEHAYFLQFKAAALTSIIEQNIGLRIKADEWEQHIDAFYYHKPRDDDYDEGWSMLSDRVFYDPRIVSFHVNFRRIMYVADSIHQNPDEDTNRMFIC